MPKSKWLSEEGLEIAVKRRETKSKGEKDAMSVNKRHCGYQAFSHCGCTTAHPEGIQDGENKTLALDS